MEKLEKISEDAPLDKRELVEVKETYQGLKLIDERIYHGGTSVMYWM